jgi:hypothetical protein
MHCEITLGFVLYIPRREPFKSTFLMSDRPLSLLDIMQTDLLLGMILHFFTLVSL